jgi:hypothetical protein
MIVHKISSIGRDMRITILVLALLTLLSCGEKDSREILGGPGLDAVDLTVVMSAQRNAFNPVSISPDIQKRLAKYNEGTKFNSKYNNIKVPFSQEGAKIIIFANGEILCKYNGSLNNTVKITDGEVGIINKEIYIKDGTRAQIDSDWYFFSNGKWRKAK